MSERPAATGPAAADETMDRRRFPRRLLGLAGRTAMLGFLLQSFHQLRKSSVAPDGARGQLGILRPPGSADEAALLSLCIRCTRCADACEPQCILFFGAEAGALQATPYIEARDRGCTLCLACGEACPTDAIRPLATMEEARMGIAVVDARLCVSLNGTGVCGACHTICPLRERAITLGMHNAPLVTEECVGCGLCEEICIVRDRRAIQIVTERRPPGHATSPRAA